MKISELKNIEPNPCDPKFYTRYFALIEVAEAARKYSKGQWHTKNCLYPGNGRDDSMGCYHCYQVEVSNLDKLTGKGVNE